MSVLVLQTVCTQVGSTQQSERNTEEAKCSNTDPGDISANAGQMTATAEAEIPEFSWKSWQQVLHPCLTYRVQGSHCQNIAAKCCKCAMYAHNAIIQMTNGNGKLDNSTFFCIRHSVQGLSHALLRKH